MDIYNQPDKTEIMDILDRLFSIVYPGFSAIKPTKSTILNTVCLP